MAGAEENPTSGASRPTGWDRLIYLPYKNLRDVFNRESGTAFMPYEQFLRLWERIGASGDSGSAKPPVSAAVTKARYVARVEKDIARIDATLTVQVLGSGWVELPIRFGAAAIGKFTASDTQALLVGTGNGAYALLLPKSGEFTIQLELTARVHSSPDGRGFEFDCPPTGITTFELTVPAADQTVEITPQLVALPVEGDGKTTRVTAQLGATRKIAARWHPRVSTAPVMEVLTTVQNVTDVRIADGLVHTQAVLNFQVLRGQVDQLQVAVPLGHNILDVTTPGIKSWKATKEEKRQVLTVELLGTESKTIPLEVRTEYPLPAEAFSPAGIDDEETVHGIHALGEFRESGLLAISAASDLSLTVEQQSGLIRAEAVEAPEALRRPDAIFYKFYSPRIRLQLAVKAVEPRILVEQQARLVFAEDELQLSSRLQYTVERAGVFELRLNVPEGVSISRVDCEQMKEFRTIDDGRVLVVTLKEKTKGQIAAMVSGQIGRDALPDEGAPIPLLEPVGPSGADVARETGTILIYAPESLEVITDVPAVQSAQPARIDPATDSGTAIKQQSKAEMPEDGWVVWTVILQRELTGDLALRVRYDTLPAAGEKGASKLVVSPVRVLDVPSPVEGQPAIVPAAVAGEIAVQKDRALSVAARADAFETIDVRELTMLPADGYLAFRYFKQPAELTDALSLELTYSRQEIQGVVQTVISQALVEAVVTDDKVVTYRGRYRLKTSERQRLAVDLPKDAEILETSVAGRRVDLEKNDDAPSSQQWNSYYVNVARQTAADEPFVLAVVFRSPYRDRPLRGREGLLALVFPRIGRPAEGAETSVALQELRTVVWVPEDYNLVGTPRGFVRERRTFIDPILGAIAYATTSADHEAWFGDNSAGMFAFKSSGRAYAYRKLGSTDTLEVAYWQTDWFTWLISGAILAIAVVLAATSWENRLTIVLLGAFGAAMYALYDADLVINALAAARFGLIAMFALWFIRALRRPPSPPAPKSPDTSPPASTGTELPTEPATPSNSPGNEPQSSDTPTVS
jgi:hypothetical protein